MDMEEICFEVISNVGSAKSSFIEAIGLAKKGEIAAARAKIAEGDESFKAGHHAHADLISKEASGEGVQVSLLLVHAEDQLMAADTARVYATEFIDLYETLLKK